VHSKPFTGSSTLSELYPLYITQYIIHTMDRFRLEERIGSGSYSEVYRATDLSTGQQCALKIMKYLFDVTRQHQ
jgi:serine/threonine protein kinase